MNEANFNGAKLWITSALSKLELQRDVSSWDVYNHLLHTLGDTWRHRLVPFLQSIGVSDREIAETAWMPDNQYRYYLTDLLINKKAGDALMIWLRQEYVRELSEVCITA